jgi:Na+/melibiose symporter-like transporter
MYARGRLYLLCLCWLASASVAQAGQARAQRSPSLGEIVTVLAAGLLLSTVVAFFVRRKDKNGADFWIFIKWVWGTIGVLAMLGVALVVLVAGVGWTFASGGVVPVLLVVGFLWIASLVRKSIRESRSVRQQLQEMQAAAVGYSGTRWCDHCNHRHHPDDGCVGL